MAGYYFNLPAITQLTLSEMSVLVSHSPFSLTGGTCFSRNIVMLWRHINNVRQSKRSLLLTYTSHLKQYLRCCCESEDKAAAQNIGTCLRNKPHTQWDEILVIEAQDMPVAYYEEIKQYGNVSYSCDDSLTLYPDHCSRQAELNLLFSSNVNYVFNDNYFRSTQRIMQFARQAFPNAIIPQRTIDGLAGNPGELPVLLITNGDSSKQNNAIVDIINCFHACNHNIGILVPWKNDILYFEKILDNAGFVFSTYYPDEQRFPNGCVNSFCSIHLTTFKCAKGIRFDTVIIPNFHKYTDICGTYNINWQDYYVACTSSLQNLYLISNYDLPQLNSTINKHYL